MWGILPAYGLYARHANDLTLHNVRFELRSPDLRPAVVCDDVDGLNLDGFRADLTSEAESLIRLRATGDLHVHNARILRGTGELTAEF